MRLRLLLSRTPVLKMCSSRSAGSSGRLARSSLPGAQGYQGNAILANRAEVITGKLAASGSAEKLLPEASKNLPEQPERPALESQSDAQPH